MGNAKGRRRRFGSVRQLRSGQWQARYRGPDGLLRPAPQTFSTKTSGEQWLTHTEADILGGDWIEERDLRPSTAQVYRYVFGRHLNPSSATGLLPTSKSHRYAVGANNCWIPP